MNLIFFITHIIAGQVNYIENENNRNKKTKLS